MHGLPCPSLGRCFGYLSDSNSDPALDPESDECQIHQLDPVTAQPDIPSSQQKSQATLDCFSSQETNGTNSSHNPQDKDDTAFCLSSSSEYDVEEEFCGEMELKYSHIPRPSIITRHPKEAATDRTASRRETEDGPLSAWCSFADGKTTWI
ncbi:uncharacterized protein LOC144016611 [Festucalex cinctus]